MHVVVDGRKLGDFGIGTYIDNLFGACLDLDDGRDFTFLGPRPGDGHLARPEVGWRDNRSTKYGLGEMVSMSWQAWRLSADVFHAPHYVFPLGLPCPGVVTVHDCIHLRFPQQLPRRGAHLYARWMMRHAVRAADRVIAVSRSTRDDLVQLIGAAPERVTVVHNGCEEYFYEDLPEESLEQTRRRYQLSERFVLYAGNVKPHKNLKRLILAFDELASADDGLELVIAGSELHRAPGLNRLRHQLGLRQRVRFLGYLPRPHLRALYHLATVFAYPSLYEGFGLPPLEAMACGTPVLASDTGSLPEVVGDAGLLVDPLDVAAIADGLRRLLRDADLRGHLAEAGRRRAQGFPWSAAARRTLSLYDEVAGS